jgi:hypothetical protein
MEDFGGERRTYFLIKSRKLKNVSKNELSAIEMLYDHQSCYSFNFFKISNIYHDMNLALQNPPYEHTLTFIQRYAQYILLRLGFRAQGFAVLVGKKVILTKYAPGMTVKYHQGLKKFKIKTKETGEL